MAGFQPSRPRVLTWSWWKMALLGTAYMIPLILLWDRTDYPNSLGVHIAAHDRKIELLEKWYYSYLLLERHHLIDVAMFFYMWLPFIGILVWSVWKRFER